jgi:hypothetical protein
LDRHVDQVEKVEHANPCDAGSKVKPPEADSQNFISAGGVK